MSTDYTELGLLLAVRDAIRELDGWNEDNCQCEFDELAPANMGDRYCAVIANGWSAGPTHRPSGGVKDFVLGVEIFVVKRVGAKQASKRRDLYLEEATGLSSLTTPILGIDFNYAVSREATRLALVAEGVDEADVTESLRRERGFTHPLVFERFSPRPQLVSGEEYFAQANEHRAGLARSIFFGGARRIRAR
jgi:hypothetical protein